MTAFWQFLNEEWYFAVPMLGLSLVALTLVFWRLLLNFDAATNLDIFLPSFQERLVLNGPAVALSFCRFQRGFIPRRLFVAGLEAAPLGRAAVRRAMAGVVELEIMPQLNFLLAPILAIAKIATMVGLLGTVISMIRIFTLISDGGSNEEVVTQAGAIGLALFATALGLVIAIPLVFAHVMLKAWVNRYETTLKSAAQKFLIILESLRDGPAPPADAPVIAASLRMPPPVRGPQSTMRTPPASQPLP